MALLFIDKVKENQSEFAAKVVDISSKLQINPDWLMLLFDHETGGTFSPQIQNQTTGAIGLIQFMPDTLNNMGISESIYSMSNVQQLSLVYQYLQPYKNLIKNFFDLYFAVFFPAAINKNDSYVLESIYPASVIAQQNSGFDLNKNSEITVSEVKQFFRNKYPSINFIKNTMKTINWIAIGLLIIIASYFIYREIKG